ncbi:UDP-N-acetylmuramoyl-tripeptide--D-alanyl-D-alanine ligase [Roseivivax isoporae]|uniref:UDP-N-acetylmuramoyl-tripeptide--D-alanyl-D-alanine ligase n=1 Tax=Roseivivax isoporae LMG 25204 TaxID=1449351 RepID=X7F403_9RHOB|nr:UDP-N-acetylmuramoyl-tripeptide--D-alanyl-D-alanine ligase [Roseivivax isoporae]ETX26804.1 UDP-N-acetylmuramoyl-tripeptide--D-alanyl-D-alanine ligase [Roseivivax isoporae LMG 25204]
MSALWTSGEAAVATGGRNTAEWSARGVSIDTRTLKPGDLFVALKAARDGHDFVAQALEKGAAAALVSRVPEGVAPDAPLLIVPDVQGGLEALGRHARARSPARVVAVTGSVGKTSTKEMLRQVLGGQGRAHAAEASYNNHWGVPLTLARMPADTDFAVVEIGMNHPGEIAPLSRMARPHVAIVTTVAPAHLAAFGSLDGIAHEKASIYEGLEPDGTAILNGDLATTPILEAAADRAGARRISFGEGAGCHHRVTAIRICDRATVAHGRAWRTQVLYKVAVPGRHFAVNAMSVIAAAGALGLDRALALADLGRWHPPAGRGQREVIPLDAVDTHLTLELIDDAYNANPASVAASLEVLAAAEVTHGIGRVARGRRIAYLGDMGELGSGEAAAHAALAELPALGAVDVVHCVGPLMAHLHDALPPARRGRWCATGAEMAEGMHRDLDAGDVVLVKGSNYMGLARLVDAIRKMRQGAEVPEA